MGACRHGNAPFLDTVIASVEVLLKLQFVILKVFQNLWQSYKLEDISEKKKKKPVTHTISMPCIKLFFVVCFISGFWPRNKPRLQVKQSYSVLSLFLKS